jgi:hypothetical protein
MTILLRGSLLQATGALLLTIVCIVLVRGPRVPAGAATGPPPPRPGDLERKHGT